MMSRGSNRYVNSPRMISQDTVTVVAGPTKIGNKRAILLRIVPQLGSEFRKSLEGYLSQRKRLSF